MVKQEVQKTLIVGTNQRTEKVGTIRTKTNKRGKREVVKKQQK